MRVLPILLVCTGACIPAGADDHQTTTERTAIVGGSATTDYPAVPQLFSGYATGEGGGCSGTLVSPRVVLTAAHCIQREEDDAIATEMSAYFGTSLFGDENFLEQIPADDWTFIEGWTLGGGDLGLVLLSWDAPAEPMPYSTVGLNDFGDIGRPIHLVGWGNTEEDAGSGVKREVSTTITDFQNQYVFRYGNSGANTCQGDSGGPAFIDVGGTEVVAGVVSYGTGGCLGISGAGRVAVFQSWIAGFIADNDVPIPPTVNIVSPADGDTVRNGFAVHVEAEDNTRVEGLELFINGAKALDIPTDLPPFVVSSPATMDGPVEVRVVATDNRGDTGSQIINVTVDSTCKTSDDCEAGFKCEGGLCVPSSGVLGEECNEDASCQSDRCGDIGGDKRCTMECDPQSVTCPENFECIAATPELGYCWPLPEMGEEEGGCGCQGSGDPGGWLGLLLVCWFLRRRAPLTVTDSQQ